MVLCASPEKVSMENHPTGRKLYILIENNLRTLKIDQIKLVHLRSMGSPDIFKAGLETMFTLQQEGKILHVGVSNVSVTDLQTAISMGNIATVENMYGNAQRTTLIQHHMKTYGGGEVLSLCEQHEIPLIPFFSLLHAIDKKDNRITEIAHKYKVSEAQVNIAWLLHQSPLILPIPGTSSLKHFEENIQSVVIELTEEDMQFLE